MLKDRYLSRNQKITNKPTKKCHYICFITKKLAKQSLEIELIR